MKYSKATNYAHHNAFLAKATQNKLVSVHQLAEMQNVSPTYLSKILTKLTKEGMIHSSSGPRAVTRLVRIGKIFHFRYYTCN